MKKPEAKKKHRDHYTAEETSFLRAVVDFRARSGRRFLRVTDHLAILKKLGYRKK